MLFISKIYTHTAPVRLTTTNSYYADDQIINSPFRNVNGSGLVAFRAIGHILGWDLDWNGNVTPDPGPMWASFTSPDGTVVRITNGSNIAQVNGRPVQMVNDRGTPVSAAILDRRFFVPIRFFDSHPQIPITIEWFPGPPQGVYVTRLESPQLPTPAPTQPLPTQYEINIKSSDDSHGTAVITLERIVGVVAASPNERLNILATSNPGFKFSHWEIVTGDGRIENETNENTVFIVGNSDAHMIAYFIPVTNLNHTINIRSQEPNQGEPVINNALRDGLVQDVGGQSVQAAAGDRLSISAHPNFNFRFSHWTVNGQGGFSDRHSEDTDFTVGNGNATITAHFINDITEEMVTITAMLSEGGIATVNEDSSVSVSPNSRVSLSAAPHSGFQFYYWEILSGDARIEDINSPTTNLTAGNLDSTIVARFINDIIEEMVTITATPSEGGIADINSMGSSVSVSPCRLVSLSATPHSSFRFSNWERLSGDARITDINSPITNLTAGNLDSTIVARFSPVDDNTQLLIRVSSQDFFGDPIPFGVVTIRETPHVVIEREDIFATPGDLLYISARPLVPGFQFHGWHIIRGEGYIESPYSPETVFITGTSNAQIVATFTILIELGRD